MQSCPLIVDYSMNSPLSIHALVWRLLRMGTRAPTSQGVFHSVLYALSCGVCTGFRNLSISVLFSQCKYNEFLDTFQI